MFVLCLLFLFCTANQGSNTFKSIVGEHFLKFQSSGLHKPSHQTKQTATKASSHSHDHEKSHGVPGHKCQHERLTRLRPPVSPIPTDPELIEKVSMKRGVHQAPIPIRIFHDISRITLPDNFTCTSPSGTVPNDFGSTTDCTLDNYLSTTKINLITQILIPAVDDVIRQYLHIKVPVSGNFIANPNITSCRDWAGPDYLPIDESYLTAPGIPNTDYVMLWTARPYDFSGSNTLADALGCNAYSLGEVNGIARASRPLIGSINLNPDSLLRDFQASDLWNFDRILRVLFHEITHAFGFSSFEYSNFVDENGDFYENPVLTTSSDFGGDTFYLDKLATPKLVATAQDFFDCSTLDGVRLENQDNGEDYHGPDDHIGSHWEMSVFPGEIMAPVDQFQQYISVFTLSMLGDTGWYVTNLSQAEPIFFGYKKGCDWINNPCSERPYPDFCTDATMVGCRPGHLSYGSCFIGDFGSDLPIPWQYDPARPSFGGRFPSTDYCWIFEAYSNGYCQQVDGRQNNRYEEAYSSSSICWDLAIPNNKTSAACWEFRCVSDPGLNDGQVTLQFHRNTGSAAIEWVSCPIDGGKLNQTINGEEITVTCPETSYFCDQTATVFDTQSTPTPTPSSPSSGTRGWDLSLSLILSVLALFSQSF